MRVQFETDFERFLKRVTLSFRWILLVALVLLIGSGIFWVESDEVAMVLRMGKLVGNTPSEQLRQPGLHFAFPYIIDEVVKVSVGRIRQLDIMTYTSADGVVNSDVTQSGYLISGDHNIVLLEAAAKYQIVDPIQFVWINGDPEKLITTVVSGELLRHSSGMDVDSLLTTSKGRLADLTKKTAQVLLDEAHCGVVLTNIELTSIMPPEEVRTDFEAVNAASVQKQTLIQGANEYRESVIPNAQAQARQHMDAAIGDQQTQIARAYNDTAVFNGLLEQYQTSPESVREGYIRQRFTELFARMRVFVVPQNQDVPRVVLP